MGLVTNLLAKFQKVGRKHDLPLDSVNINNNRLKSSNLNLPQALSGDKSGKGQVVMNNMELMAMDTEPLDKIIDRNIKDGFSTFT